MSDDEWALVVPYLTLLPEAAGQRGHGLREMFLRYVLKTGAPWRWMPNDLPPWAAVYQQARRWMAAGCFDALADDLRRAAPGSRTHHGAECRDPGQPHPAVQPRAGERAGHDGARRRRGSKLHRAVDTLGHLLALHVTAASADDRTEAGRLAEAIQDATGDSVSLAHVDQGRAGERAAGAARAHGIELEVVKLPEARRGFVLLPRRWVANGRSPGPPASAAWPGTTSAAPPPWPTCTASPSSASCSNKPLSSRQINNSL